MKKKNEALESELVDKFTRQHQIDKLEQKQIQEMKSKKAELKRRLLKYQAKIIRGNFISISETNYHSILQYDSELSLLITDLQYKIQLQPTL
jgi:hypothetical protein